MKYFLSSSIVIPRLQLALASLPTKEERIEQLKEEYQAHEDEYRRILSRLELSE